MTRPDEFTARDTWLGGRKGFTMSDLCNEMDAIKVERQGRKGFAAPRQVGVGLGVGWRWRAPPPKFSDQGG